MQPLPKRTKSKAPLNNNHNHNTNTNTSPNPQISSTISTTPKKHSKHNHKRNHNHKHNHKHKQQQDDWITALAKQTSHSESQATSMKLSSKADRIQKRKQKQQQRTARKLNTLQPPHDHQITPTSSSSSWIQDLRTQTQTQTQTRKERSQKQSQINLHQLMSLLERTVHQHPQYSRKQHKHNPKLHTFPISKPIPITQTLNYFPLFLNPTILASQNLPSSNKYHQQLQPRTRDYGGLGLARPSISISLQDPSFIPKLHEEFQEHIHGFFGKQRTKAMKKQLDGNMLWRKLVKVKQQQKQQQQLQNPALNSDHDLNSKRKGPKRTKGQVDFMEQRIHGVKLADMCAEERVEAMIQAGML